MNNPVWEWLIRSKLSAYRAAEHFEEPPSRPGKSGWCFDRFGQSSTQLADGRCVLIAGEHEDFYDPDFHIYNDVVVQHRDGKMDIFGYPRDVFSPTDFHTATLSGNRIIIIGNLCYLGERKPGRTPVCILDLETFAITSIAASGPSPGWIHEHSAAVSGDGSSILIKGGTIDPGGEDQSLVENIDEWCLHLADWRWERLTDHQWERREFLRQDRKQNHLWEMEQALWSNQRMGWEDDFRKHMQVLDRECGALPNLDLLGKLYRPAIPHEVIAAAEDEYKITRIIVNGVVVRYVQEMLSIQMTVEGDLPKSTVDLLTSDLLEKFATLENAPCEVRRI